ncbi:MAG: hypothetical protein JST16_18025 [Bdellovibrionales bacterium]|nr:hypothetical protein [Bdellovibrionales bacterium]
MKSPRLRQLTTATLLLSTLFATVGYAATPLPGSMGALGDSITAAAFANFRRTEGIYPWMQHLFFDELLVFIINGKKPRVLERPNLSWSTGIDSLKRMESHNFRLRTLRQQVGQKAKFPAGNFAVTGAQTWQVRQEQLPALRAWSESKLNQPYPDYVTLLIGANDICGATNDAPSAAAFEDDMDAIVDEILVSSPNTRVLISSFPRLQDVPEVFGDASVTRNKSCQDVWKLTKMCHRVTLKESAGGHEQIAREVEDFHAAMARVAKTKSAEFGDRVRYSSAVQDMPLDPNDVSMDCFHPNPEGQGKLSQLSWNDSWWK